jgi:hypothetical protein
LVGYRNILLQLASDKQGGEIPPLLHGRGDES